MVFDFIFYCVTTHTLYIEEDLHSVRKKLIVIWGISTCILRTTDAILEVIEKKELTATVLLDMSKAFNSLDHETLLSKLQDIDCHPHVSQTNGFAAIFSRAIKFLKFIMLFQTNFL